MSFGWYQELQREIIAGSLDAAVTELSRLLDQGAMIVHIYRDEDRENPEVVGRHGRLRSFIAAEHGTPRQRGSLPHEVERFLLDPNALEVWTSAKESGDLVDRCWSVVDLFAANEREVSNFYGKALLVAPEGIDSSAQLATGDPSQAHF